MDKIKIPPSIENINETIKIIEKPNCEITKAAITGAIAWVRVFPKL